MPDKRPFFLGVDIGGTAIKLGAVDAEGQILAEDELPVRPGTGAEAILEQVEDRARGLAAGPMLGIGVGVAGLLERSTGRVVASPNLRWLEGVRPGHHLKRRFGAEVPCVVENDANAAAVAELWLGAGRGHENLLLVTLGTGIGGGLVLAGKLTLGEGLAGEIGHVKIDPEGPTCGCGARGCLETFASASAARRRALDLGLPADDPGNLVQLTERARAGQGPEKRLLGAIGRDLGRGLAQVVALLDVRTFVFSGGFSRALDVLEDGIRQGLREWDFGERVSALNLLPAQVGPSAGWIGAARLAMPNRES